MENIVWIFLIGGIVVLDSTAFAQLMLNQPIVSCFTLGFVFGDIQTGVLLGLLLEYPWLRLIPAGGSIPNQGNFGSFVTASIALSLAGIFPGKYYQILFFAILMGFGASYLGAKITIQRRKLNFKIVEKAFESISAGNIKKAEFWHLLSALVTFVAGGALAVFFSLIGVEIFSRVFHNFQIPEFIAFKIAVFSLAGIGAGTLISMIVASKKLPLFILGIFCGVIALYLLP